MEIDRKGGCKNGDGLSGIVFSGSTTEEVFGEWMWMGGGVDQGCIHDKIYNGRWWSTASLNKVSRNGNWSW